MHESLNVGLAFIAGVASFVSPCILPLIPAYLSLMGGTSLDNLQRSRSLRWSAVVNTAFFIVGFTVVFVALGVLFSSAFGLLGSAVEVVNIVAGALVILLGINFIFDFIAFLNLERRFQFSGRPTSKIGSVVFGMAFGAGWTPCIGPILGSILFLAGSQTSIVRGTSLLLVYSLGLGVPFLLTALFLSPALRQMAKLKRHFGAVKIASGVFLVLIGVLIVFGELKSVNAFAFGIATRLEDWAKAAPVAARVVPAAFFAAFALLVALFYYRRLRADGGARADHRADGAMESDSEDNSLPGSADPTATVERRAAVSPAAAAEGRLFRPVRAAFLFFFALLAGLSLAGVLQIPHLLAVWFSYQGI